ncbi:rhomboid family intramembrane serine protease [Larkinella rosea]|uniref:rhomboid family intramembrane serine protease n=1 Tax=Larkinella rosea TaxID=2025312 RepID=UPI00163A4679|nr:rhomboid family intramembrane serine protease [Larkinella rosea]
MITLGLIATNIILSLYCFSNIEGFEKLFFVPNKIKGDHSQNYRFITHGFIHADAGHLLFNMITLYFFGREVEGGILPSFEFILFYLLAIVFSCLPAYQKQKNNPDYKAVGASGAVSAVMFVLVLYAPWSVIYLKFIIPVYFILFATGYLIYSSYQSNYGEDNVAHDVHLWGMLFGIAYMFLLHPASLRTFINRVTDAPFF